MRRYIDADKLCEGLKHMAKYQEPYKQSTILGVVSTIENTRTADVVEVVRCDKCKHLNIINRREVYAKCRMTDLEFKPFDIDTRKHYCSYGERREKNEG